MTDNTSTDIWGEPTTDESEIFDFENEGQFSDNNTEDETEGSNENESDNINEENKEESESNTSTDEFEIVVNGEKKQLTIEQLKTEAQKGMDYDRIREERDRFRTAYKEYGNAYEMLKGLAEESGMNLKDYLSEVKTNIENQKIETIAEKLIENGTDENTAREMARLQFERDRATKELEGIRNANDIQEKQQSEIDNAIQNDMQRLEKIIGKPVTDELLNSLEKYFKEGMTIVEAYMQKTIDEQNLKLQTQEQNEKNKQRSTGSVKTQKAINQDDDIIAALMDA